MAIEFFQNIYQHPLISNENLEKIKEAHQKVEVKKGTFLLEENKIANEYYLVEKGLIRAFVHDYNQQEITTEFFSNNEIAIQPSSLFQQSPSAENIQTITDCTLWKITFDDFQELFHAMEGLTEWGRLWFTFQLFAMKQRSIDMVTKTATQRYQELLKENPEIIQQAPLKQIASYLGITDSSLSRIRKEMVKH